MVNNEREIQNQPDKGRKISIKDALHLAVTHQKNKNLLEAERLYKLILKEDTNNFDALHMLGLVSHDLKKCDLAIEFFDRACAIKGDYAPLQFNIGRLMTDIGRYEEAKECFAKAIEYDPGHSKAQDCLEKVIKFVKPSDDLIEQMQEEIQSGDIEDQKYKSQIYFALGKVFDDVQEYGMAFDYYKDGNQTMRATFEYCVDDDKKKFDEIKKVFSKGFFADRIGWGSSDKAPLFILGMPRSGTSLLEQILSSHSRVYGAGEINDLKIVVNANEFPANMPGLLPDEVEKIAGNYISVLRSMSSDAEYITDKMPQNFQLIGAIHLLFPNAKIIHCMRDPLDTCFSIYKQNFENIQRFAYSLPEIAEYYKLYQGLMQHWLELFPLKIYNVVYEDVVNDIEGETRKLLEYLGLAFEKTCLDFHKNTRAVTTSSNVQVRSPLYSSSVGAWKNYKEHLGELIDVLGDVSSK